MSQMPADKLLDLSTADEFCFGLYCDECGKLWKSSPVFHVKSFPFSRILSTVRISRQLKIENCILRC